MATKGLTDKQRRFCNEYLVDLNATRAYMAAYPSTKKESTASVCAAKLLRNAKVKEYLKERKKAQQERVEIRQDDVLRELARIAFVDVTDIVSVKNGKIRIADTDDLPPEKRKIIAGLKEGRDGLEIKFYDRLRALEMLCRHLGMFDQKDDLDRKEQEARIAKLKRDTEAQDEQQEIKVSIMGMSPDELSEVIG